MSQIRLLSNGESFRLNPLRQRSDIELQVCTDPDEAALTLVDNEMSALVLDLSVDISCVLELLGLWRSLQLRLPVIALIAPAEATDLPLRWSPLLHLIDPEMPAEELEQSILSAIEDATTPRDRESFRTSDFLQLTLLSQQSVALNLRFSAGAHLQVEIVGGDIWSAFCGDLAGEEALAAHLQDTPNTLKADPIEKLPKQRFLRESAPRLLRRSLRHQLRAAGVDDSQLPPEPSPRDASDDPASDTQPFQTDLLKEILDGSPELLFDEPPIDGPTPVEPTPDEPTIDEPTIEEPTLEEPATAEQAEVAVDEKELAEDEFEQLFQAGMDAALVRDYDQALASFEKALSLRPADSRVTFNIQRIRQRLDS